MCRASFGPRVTSFSWEPTDPPSVTPPMPSDVKLSARRLRKKASVNLPMVINEPRHRCAGHKEFGVHHAATPEDSSEEERERRRERKERKKEKKKVKKEKKERKREKEGRRRASSGSQSESDQQPGPSSAAAAARRRAALSGIAPSLMPSSRRFFTLTITDAAV